VFGAFSLKLNPFLLSVASSIYRFWLHAASFSQCKTLQSAFGWFVIEDLSHLGTYWSLPMLCSTLSPQVLQMYEFSSMGEEECCWSHPRWCSDQLVVCVQSREALAQLIYPQL